MKSHVSLSTIALSTSFPLCQSASLHCAVACTWLPKVADLNWNFCWTWINPALPEKYLPVYLFQTNNLVTPYRGHRKTSDGPRADEQMNLIQQRTSLSFTNPGSRKIQLAPGSEPKSPCVWSSPNFIQDQFKDFIFLVKRSYSRVWEYSLGTSVDFEISLFLWNWLRRLWLILLRDKDCFSWNWLAFNLFL